MGSGDLVWNKTGRVLPSWSLYSSGLIINFPLDFPGFMFVSHRLINNLLFHLCSSCPSFLDCYIQFYFNSILDDLILGIENITREITRLASSKEEGSGLVQRSTPSICRTCLESLPQKEYAVTFGKNWNPFLEYKKPYLIMPFLPELISLTHRAAATLALFLFFEHTKFIVPHHVLSAWNALSLAGRFSSPDLIWHTIFSERPFLTTPSKVDLCMYVFILNLIFF